MNRYIVKLAVADGQVKWLAKIAEGTFDYVADRSKAHVFPSEQAARGASYAGGRSYRTPPEILPAD
jgi:hypothetical protein